MVLGDRAKVIAFPIPNLAPHPSGAFFQTAVRTREGLLTSAVTILSPAIGGDQISGLRNEVHDQIGGLRKAMHEGFAAISRRLDQIIQMLPSLLGLAPEQITVTARQNRLTVTGAKRVRSPQQ